MHDQLEAFVANVPSSGDPVEIPLKLLGGNVVQFRHSEGAEPDAPGGMSELAQGDVVSLVSLPTFKEQWGTLHDMLGGMASMRMGAPCPLGEQARSEGGRVACEAAYNLISSSPGLSRMILSPESTFFGQLAAVGVHGFACVQIVQASARGEIQSPETDESEFEYAAE